MGEADKREKPRDWSEVLKGATPEAVARALLQPRKPIKPRPGVAGRGFKDRI